MSEKDVCLFVAEFEAMRQSTMRIAAVSRRGATLITATILITTTAAAAATITVTITTAAITITITTINTRARTLMRSTLILRRARATVRRGEM